jgi:hypothetical protein
MSTEKLSNVTVADFREFLAKAGLSYVGTEGGHEKWARQNLTRPVIVQTHISPVPEFIVRNALRTLGLTRRDFFNILFEVKSKDNPPQPGDEATTQVMDDNDLCYCGSGKRYKECHKRYDERKK